MKKSKIVSLKIVSLILIALFIFALGFFEGALIGTQITIDKIVNGMSNIKVDNINFEFNQTKLVEDIIRLTPKGDDKE